MKILAPLCIGSLCLTLLTGVVQAQGTTTSTGVPTPLEILGETAATTSEATVTVAAFMPASDYLDPRIELESIPGDNLEIGDFVVGPGRVEVVVAPGQTVNRDITVTNRISDDREFRLMVEDMSGSADGSEAVVLLGDQDGPYSLRDFISFPQEKIKLDLGQRAKIPITITMPPNAEPGGYYGGVLVTTVQDDGSDGTELARSPIVARIGTLFFISVPGATEIGGEVVDFSTINDQWWFSNGPINMSIAFENSGSIHLNPYGEVRVTNMFGAEVGFLELEPWFVLPKSLRVREITWNSELLLGRYTMTASVNRGYEDLIDIKVLHFWVVPWKFILTVFAVLFAVFFVIRLFLRTFELKRK